MRKLFLALALLCSWAVPYAQEYFPDNSAVKTNNTNYTAFTNAKIHVGPSQVIDKGTLLIQNGKVVQVGKSIPLPKNTVVVDVSGKYIYPSFIDAYSNFGVAKPKRAEGSGRSPQYEPTRDGFYWNDHVMPENKAIDQFKYDDKKAEALRKAGFGVVNSHIQDGIVRGTGVLVALNGDGNDADRILDDRSAQYLSFSKSVTSRQSYPTSLMGAMALLRQLYTDADWYQKGHVPTKDRSLEALIANRGEVQIFMAGDKNNMLRADGIADQFNLQYVLVGGGDEYQRIADIKAANAPLIIPINFPKAYDVSDPHQADYVSLKDMRHWNLAPTNPKVLAENGVPFAMTLHQLKKPGDLMGKLQKALKYGLPKEKALEALTTAPAKILGKSATLGSLEKGKWANFLITSGDIFAEGTILYENWVQGIKNSINPMDTKDIRGAYDLMVDGTTYSLKLAGEAAKPKATLQQDTLTLKSKFSYKDQWINLSFATGGGKKNYRLSGLVADGSQNISGRALLPNGNASRFSLNKKSDHEDPKEAEKKEAKKMPTLVSMPYPLNGYGTNGMPKSETLLFRNATVWTGEADGILQNTDVLVRDGKIAKVGKDLNAGRATVIDATNKHLTAGIFDEHSHIALKSVNEAGHNSTAEVTMEDVVDAEDVDIYRNLAGGVTSMQLLHGSANPIGGRSAIIKLKWGGTAQDLIYDDSPKFIKFALGENVKQSNWQSFSRFPQTRMGVEQVFIDYFQRAKEYGAKKNSGQAYRYDQEMEVLWEILNGERFITCHSYVQSEINMLMKVAEKFGFRVNTFTHILEGYKVADKMAAHGVGGSTFSDWWAYKYEVNDAIPYNAAIMQSQGVTVAINSDDAEMSRRLNQEAAKAVKYGGVSEEEAWKMVTLNPAKLLHLDHRVGSIKEGKDADLVLWSHHPLSVYAKAEKTLIEGAVFFDLEKDKTQREAIKKERSQLIDLMLAEKAGGGKTQAPKQRKKEHLHCDSL
ncbi:MAG: amidohydrolase family protein [Flavobacteriaceae bacterium]